MNGYGYVIIGYLVVSAFLNVAVIGRRVEATAGGAVFHLCVTGALIWLLYMAVAAS